MDRVDEDLGGQLKLYVQAALGRKARDLLLLDVRELTTLADVFMLCTGRSNRQVSAIADHIRRFLKDHGIRPLYVEGMKEGHWVLLDYGQVVIHVFYEPVRQFYDLESLWADARPLPIDEIIEQLPDDDDQADGAET
ncbi:MAG: ribosome silencing factor [Desulfobacterales bacterium]